LQNGGQGGPPRRAYAVGFIDIAEPFAIVASILEAEPA
jgi:hypothetical protein